jgi:hypothetical protein
LRVTTSGKTDLIEGEPDIAVPVEGAHDQPQLAVGVQVIAGRERTRREVTQAVM